MTKNNLSFFDKDLYGAFQEVIKGKIKMASEVKKAYQTLELEKFDNSIWKLIKSNNLVFIRKTLRSKAENIIKDTGIKHETLINTLLVDFDKKLTVFTESVRGYKNLVRVDYKIEFPNNFIEFNDEFQEFTYNDKIVKEWWCTQKLEESREIELYQSSVTLLEQIKKYKKNVGKQGISALGFKQIYEHVFKNIFTDNDINESFEIEVKRIKEVFSNEERINDHKNATKASIAAEQKFQKEMKDKAPKIKYRDPEIMQDGTPFFKIGE
ncbi:hypothetical protein MG290_14700 (plasmid) [Flavobacterium sp. CBA20B-1]|uniref:hypothetical protein n=1 Tax=unclassified Flavobacterium TaxID=196869 RepID=UPI002224DD71|nr:MULTISPECIES: hypothetical protein [unclassified Flavobacterium]WCM43611.1 hypothetical protein MG290_14700 [Flavobacterium sp. CBA20B-1]